jgi:polysaccharide export outer membrane protein
VRRALLAGLLVAALCPRPPIAAAAMLDGSAAADSIRGSVARGIPYAQAGPVDPREYVVGPGDGFQLSLLGPVSRELELTVGPEGSLFLPGIGAVDVAGRTLADARVAIERALSGEFRGVKVLVRLSRIRRMLVTLAGEVRQPGPLEVSGDTRVGDALPPDALGPHASTRNVILERRSDAGVERIHADVERARRVGGPRNNPLLRDGDIVRVPVASGFVWVEGAVGDPGRFEWAAGDSLRTLIALAGGPLASSDGTGTLVRFRDETNSDSTRFSLADVLSGDDDEPLREGDHVFVYFRPRYHELHRATVLGEVQRPGPYPLDPGHTQFSELIRAAGGFLPDANLAAIRVFRASSLAKEADPELERLSRLARNEMTASEYEVLRARLSARREDYRVSWNRLQSTPDLDLVLEDGDIVRVERVLPSVRVDGEVRRPGVVQYAEGRSVDEYIRIVGGLSDRAARGQVRVTRAVTGQTILARNVASIAPGDLIWVPERGDQSLWQQFQTTILVLAQIATVIIAVRK